jgi:transposase
MAGPRQAQVRPQQAALETDKQHAACSVSGTNSDARHWSAGAIIAADKAQSHAEGGFRFRKDPLVFVASLCVKKPSRVQGLFMVMTFAVLGYAVTQRR